MILNAHLWKRSSSGWLSFNHLTFIGTSWTVSAFKSSAFEVDGTFMNVRTDDDAIIADYIKIFESYESFQMSHMICVKNYVNELT